LSQNAWLSLLSTKIINGILKIFTNTDCRHLLTIYCESARAEDIHGVSKESTHEAVLGLLPIHYGGHGIKPPGLGNRSSDRSHGFDEWRYD
jgi:hypothetical protein